MKEVDSTKPSGINDISTKVLKHAMTICKKQFYHIMEFSIMSASLPRDWTTTLITLLPKTGNLKDVTNWRPISILPVPSKILEKLVQKHFIGFLNDKSLLSQCQYGFRKGFSTAEAIYDYISDLYNARNNHNYVASV